MPLIRRLPKRGFNNAAFHKHYAIVNLDDLSGFKAGSLVNEEVLRESKLIRGHVAGLKILGGGELKHGLKIEADKISASAREKIEGAGGSVTLRKQRAAQSARVLESVPVTATEEAPLPEKKTAVKKPAAKKKAPAKAAPKKKPARKS